MMLQRIKRFVLRRYLCATCRTEVKRGEVHEHGCVLEEGQKCGAVRCNKAGACVMI